MTLPLFTILLNLFFGFGLIQGLQYFREWHHFECISIYSQRLDCLTVILHCIRSSIFTQWNLISSTLPHFLVHRWKFTAHAMANHNLRAVLVFFFLHIQDGSFKVSMENNLCGMQALTGKQNNMVHTLPNNASWGICYRTSFKLLH